MAGGGGQRLNPAARALALRARLPCMDARRTSARAALTQQDHAAQVESASRPPPPSKPSEGLAGSLSSERRGRPAKSRETGPSEVEWVGRSLSPRRLWDQISVHKRGSGIGRTGGDGEFGGEVPGLTADPMFQEKEGRYFFAARRGATG